MLPQSKSSDSAILNTPQKIRSPHQSASRRYRRGSRCDLLELHRHKG
jgi:hypothetical protein